jgi:hypothetical protein
VHLVLRGEDAVILDARQDAYHCLVGVAQMLVARPGDTLVEIKDQALLAALEDADFITPSLYALDPRLAPPKPASQDLLAQPATGARSALAPFVAALLRAAPDYYGRRLPHLLASVRRPAEGLRALIGCEPSPALVAVVQGFQAWLPWTPFQGVCLYRSFMLLRRLQAEGFDALWVFGVRTWPFEAHCWLQVGDVVLDDGADRISAYTPILVT